MTKLTKYLLFTFISSWILFVIGSSDHSKGSVAGDMGFSYATSLCMFMPTIGALVAKEDFRKMGWNPKLDKNIKPALIAWLSPTVFQIIGAVCYYIVFPKDLDTSGAFMKEFFPHDFELYEKCGSSFVRFYAKETLASLTSFYLIPAVVLGLGEEIGWRGCMFPELKERFGYTKGVLIGGAIHGAWHFPLMLLIGYEYGKDYIGAPLLGLFAFCVFSVATGIISDFLYEKSHSIWYSGLFHGCINSTVNVFLLGADERRTIFGPSDIGLVAVIPIVLFAAGIIYFKNRNADMEFEEI